MTFVGPNHSSNYSVRRQNATEQAILVPFSVFGESQKITRLDDRATIILE